MITEMHRVFPGARVIFGPSAWGSAGYSGYGRQGWGGSDWMASTAGLVVLLTIVMLVVAAYWTFRAIWLVVRVLWQHPHERRLWVVLGACLGTWAVFGLVAAFATSPPAVLESLLVAAITVTAVLLLTAKLVELQDDTLFQRAFSKETLIEDVLTRPWWKAA